MQRFIKDTKKMRWQYTVYAGFIHYAFYFRECQSLTGKNKVAIRITVATCGGEASLREENIVRSTGADQQSCTSASRRSFSSSGFVWMLTFPSRASQPMAA